jgi:hypothetical protein
LHPGIGYPLIVDRLMAGVPNLTSLVFREGDRIRDYQDDKETVRTPIYEFQGQAHSL